MPAADQPLPPMPPNLGWEAYPKFEPVAKIMDAIARWKNGQRPTAQERTRFPGVYRTTECSPETPPPVG